MDKNIPQSYNDQNDPTQIYYLFESAEELWFWFMRSLEAREDGAKCGHNNSERPRPCEPNDIYQIINRLHRTRRLLVDHLRILAHYGKRGFCPDYRVRQEQKALTLWKEAFEVLTPILETKKFLKPRIYLAYSK